MKKTASPKIAIVGMACRFPGDADNPEKFWDILADGKDVVTEIPDERWNKEKFFHPDKNEVGKSYTWAAGALNDIDKFDADFFGISPREASQLDPQQRLLLEMTWEAFEDAGIKPSEMSGTDCSVFVGISNTDYANSRLDDLASGNAYFMTGSTLSIASNRMSYVFDLHGPSMSIDTACSSSLVAMHEACRSIANGESSSAICGGINILLTPFPYAGFSKASMLSPDGRCKAFDADGNGYVRAEGGGVVYLKPLDQAIADGNPIYSVIRGTGVNSDGRTNGIALPNSAAQEDLLRTVYKAAKINPDNVAYLEAHGTGTAVGDPAETGAIGRFLGKVRATDKPLLIGSVKTNIGHLEPGSGMAGVIKAALTLRHKKIPPSLHFNTPNPHIDFKGLNLKVVKKLTRLPKTEGPAAIGVNSFGFGGTNAHVVMEEYIAASPEASKTAAPRRLPRQLPPFMLSARSSESLKSMAGQYAELLADGQVANYYDTAWSVLQHREQHSHRMAVFADSVGDVAKHLAAYAANQEVPSIATGEPLNKTAKIAYVFSGNGAQWQGMGQELLKTDATFLSAVKKVDKLHKAHADWSIIDELNAQEQKSRLEFTEYAQPTLFAIQVGLVEMLSKRGITPGAVFGHSVGEVAAAWAAGALTLKQAVKVIHFRSAAQALTKGHGRMAAATIAPDDASTLLKELGVEDRVEVAAINSPGSITLSGDLDILRDLKERFESAELFYRLLDLDYAFHSRKMDPIEDTLVKSLKGLRPSKGDIPFFSTVTGNVLDGTKLSTRYWWDNIRQPVQFGPALSNLIADGFNVFVEISPHAIMQMYLNEAIRAQDSKAFSVSTMKRNEVEKARVEAAAAQVLVHAGIADMSTYFPVPGRFIQPPRYPWNREHHWFEKTTESIQHIHSSNSHPLLGVRQSRGGMVWENLLDIRVQEYLADHRVDGTPVFPAAGFIEMALAASHEIFDSIAHDIEGFEIYRPLVFEEDRGKSVRFSVNPADNAFTIESRARLTDDAWTLNAVGRLAGAPHRSAAKEMPPGPRLAKVKQTIGKKEHYALAESLHLSYGPAFQGVSEVLVVGRDALARIKAPKSVAKQIKNYQLHPSILDSGFQTLFDLLSEHLEHHAGTVFLPSQMGRIIQYGAAKKIEYCLVRIRRSSSRSIVADFHLLDEDGLAVVELDDCRFRRADFTLHHGDDVSRFKYNLVPAKRRDSGEVSPLLPSRKLIDRTRSQVKVLSREHNRAEHYDTILPYMDAMVASTAHHTLATLCTNPARFTVDELIAEGKVKKELRPFLIYLLHVLEEDELAECNDDVWSLIDAQDLPDGESLWRAVVMECPAYLPEMSLAGRAVRNLDAILDGRFDINEITQDEHEGSMRDHYRDNAPSINLANQTLASLLEETVAAWPHNRPLRILEICGGGGAHAMNWLSVLPEDGCDYIFTDPDEDAVISARTRFKGFSFITTQTLDPQKDLIEQGFDDSGFDIVIAPCSLHKSDHITQTLGHVFDVLSPGGAFFVLETHPERLINLIHGGDSKWWARTKHAERPLPRLLSAQTWETILDDGGLVDVESLAEPTDGAAAENFIVIGRKPKLPTKPDLHLPIAANTNLSEPQRCWMILRDSEGYSAELGAILEDALVSKGHIVLTATEGAKFKELSDTEFNVNPKRAKDFEALMRAAAEHDCDGIVHLMGLTVTDEDTPTQVMDILDRRLVSTTYLLQAVDTVGVSSILDLCLVTSHAHVVSDEKHITSPVQAPLWAMGRVIANEHPNIQSHLIDLHYRADPLGGGSELARELAALDDEDEIVLTPQARYAFRLDNMPAAELTTPKDMPIQLDFDTPGPLHHLYWCEFEPKPPRPEEIQVRVRATGLNFRDVMWAMGLLLDEAVENGFAGPTLGMECSGEVVSVGSAVTDLHIGDEVICFAPACFSSHVTTKASAAIKKPPSLSFEEAATVPITFFTAYYSMKKLAQIEPGETILIHGAAGGVGLAAIQIAEILGANVIATAGSDEKRDFIKLLGVEHVLDSRSLAFADDVMKITKGSGVDVVLNSLAGEAITRNLHILKPFGRFLELGKRDFYANTKIGLKPFRNNISYFGIDADQLLIERPELAFRIFGEMMKLFEDRVLTPLPYRAYPHTRAVEAFRHMQQSRHIGKVIVTLGDSRDDIRRTAVEQPKLKLKHNATYMITGGLGGFGLATARWLVEKGARTLALVGRSGAKSAAAKAAVKALEKSGATVHVIKADVANEADMAAAFTDIKEQLPPLKGIIHAAMVIDDGMIRNLDAKRFHKVLVPKVVGAMVLDKLSRTLNLDHFVMYSSATTYFGNPGQANYVAANAYLEALADKRHAEGLPALAASWGAIADVGYLAQNEDVRDALGKRFGKGALDSDEALQNLEKLLVNSDTNAAVLKLDWGALLRAMPAIRAPKFHKITHAHGGESVIDGDGEEIIAILRSMSSEDAQEKIIEMLMELVASILGTGVEKLEIDRSVTDMGMDSLMGMELGMMVEERLGIQLPMMAISEGGSIRQLSERINRQIMGGENTQSASTQENVVNTLLSRHSVDVSDQDKLQYSKAPSNAESGNKRLIK